MRTLFIIFSMMLFMAPYIIIYKLNGFSISEEHEESTYIALFNTLICICSGVFGIVFKYVDSQGLLVLMEWSMFGFLIILMMFLRMILRINGRVFNIDKRTSEHNLLHLISLCSLMLLLLLSIRHTIMISDIILNTIGRIPK